MGTLIIDGKNVKSISIDGKNVKSISIDGKIFSFSNDNVYYLYNSNLYHNDKILFPTHNNITSFIKNGPDIYYSNGFDIYKNDTLLYTLHPSDSNTRVTNIAISGSDIYIAVGPQIYKNDKVLYSLQYTGSRAPFIAYLIVINSDVYYSAFNTNGNDDKIYKNGVILYDLVSSSVSGLTSNGIDIYYIDNKNEIYKNGVLLYKSSAQVIGILTTSGSDVYYTDTTNKIYKNNVWIPSITSIHIPLSLFVKQDDIYYSNYGRGTIHKNNEVLYTLGNPPSGTPDKIFVE